MYAEARRMERLYSEVAYAGRTVSREAANNLQRLWRTMAEAGLTGITVPEAFGGLGGNEIDLALVLEEAGRAALPEPRQLAGRSAGQARRHREVIDGPRES